MSTTYNNRSARATSFRTPGAQTTMDQHFASASHGARTPKGSRINRGMQLNGDAGRLVKQELQPLSVKPHKPAHPARVDPSPLTQLDHIPIKSTSRSDSKHPITSEASGNEDIKPLVNELKTVLDLLDEDFGDDIAITEEDLLDLDKHVASMNMTMHPSREQQLAYDSASNVAIGRAQKVDGGAAVLGHTAAARYRPVKELEKEVAGVPKRSPTASTTHARRPRETEEMAGSDRPVKKTREEKSREEKSREEKTREEKPQIARRDTQLQRRDEPKGHIPDREPPSNRPTWTAAPSAPYSVTSTARRTAHSNQILPSSRKIARRTGSFRQRSTSPTQSTDTSQVVPGLETDKKASIADLAVNGHLKIKTNEDLDEILDILDGLLGPKANAQPAISVVNMSYSTNCVKHITFAILPEEHTLLRLGGVLKRIGDAPIFGRASRVIVASTVSIELFRLAHLNPAVPTTEEAMAIEPGDEAMYMRKIAADLWREKKALLKCFARIANPDALCIDYNIPTINDEVMFLTLREIHKHWSNLKTVYIHSALDDLPFLFVGVRHEVFYHQASYPFSSKNPTMTMTWGNVSPNATLHADGITLKPIDEWDSTGEDEDAYFKIDTEKSGGNMEYQLDDSDGETYVEKRGDRLRRLSGIGWLRTFHVSCDTLRTARRYATRERFRQLGRSGVLH